MFWSGPLVPSFEKARFALKPGELVTMLKPSLATTSSSLTKRRKEKKGRQGRGAGTCRHILISEAGRVTILWPAEIRTRAVPAPLFEQEKQKKVIEDIVKRSHVTVAENFSLRRRKLRKLPAMPPGFSPGNVTAADNSPNLLRTKRSRRLWIHGGKAALTQPRNDRRAFFNDPHAIWRFIRVEIVPDTGVSPGCGAMFGVVPRILAQACAP